MSVIFCYSLKMLIKTVQSATSITKQLTLFFFFLMQFFFNHQNPIYFHQCGTALGLDTRKHRPDLNFCWIAQLNIAERFLHSSFLVNAFGTIVSDTDLHFILCYFHFSPRTLIVLSWSDFYKYDLFHFFFLRTQKNKIASIKKKKKKKLM